MSSAINGATIVMSLTVPDLVIRGSSTRVLLHRPDAD